MGNLGDYQTMTTLAKKMGGPKVFAASLVLSGVAIGSARTKVVAASKAVLARRGESCPTKGMHFKIVADAVDGSGAKFRAGGEYRVLECDGDAILIEIVGDQDNPYVVSSEFLATVSSYPASSTDDDLEIYE